MAVNNPTARAGRSPAYPFLSLPEAIERAKLLYNHQRKNAVSPRAAMEAFGYTSESGTSRRVLAALIHFGLIDEQGKSANRKVRLTEEARKVILLPETDPERQKIVIQMALHPKIYQEMISQWPETLPSDTEIARFLAFEKGYNEDTVRGLIKNFKETYEYAGLGDATVYVGDDADLQQVEESYPETKRPRQASFDPRHTAIRSAQEKQPNSMSSATGSSPIGSAISPPWNTLADFRTYTLPISAGRIAYLQAPTDISAEDFELLSLSLQLIQRSLSSSRNTILETSDTPANKTMSETERVS